MKSIRCGGERLGESHRFCTVKFTAFLLLNDFTYIAALEQFTVCDVKKPDLHFTYKKLLLL